MQRRNNSKKKIRGNTWGEIIGKCMEKWEEVWGFGADAVCVDGLS